MNTYDVSGTVLGTTEWNNEEINKKIPALMLKFYVRCDELKKEEEEKYTVC